jgi:hypothetical protein
MATKVTPTKARVELARTFLRQYDEIERKTVAPQGWLMLRFSCTVKEADALYAAATAEDTRKAAQKATAVVCPDCGAEIQASIKFDCDVDPATGEITQDLTGGEIGLYCSVECGWSADHGDLASVDDWPEPIKADDLEASDGK